MKAKPGVDCAALTADPPIEYQRGVNRMQDRVGTLCPPGDPVRANYDQGNIEDLVSAAGTSTITDDTAAVFPTVTALSNRADRRCRTGILNARRDGFLRLYRAIAKCQKRLDQKSTTFGPLAPECATAGSRIPNKIADAVQRACNGSDAGRVGSCAPLPDCVSNAVASDALGLAESTYALATLCGNGVIDQGEECDDGNQITTDDCVNCQTAVCLDGFVHAGVEQCDDGNQIDDDCCSTSCTGPICGDGIVAQGCEQCDDAITPGCQGCKFVPAVCPASGRIQATLAIFYDRVGAPALSGASIYFNYPGTSVSLPNVGGAIVDGSRFIDLSGKGAFIAGQDTDTNQDGSEDRVEILYALTNDVFEPGNVVAVSFDCGAGSSVLPPDFSCSLHDAADIIGNDVPNAESIPCSVSAVFAE
jgi:cysteine-rich repeat protein